MTTDMQSAINISWNGYGKVQDIRYLTTQQESPGPLKLSFTYDVNATRLTKTYYRKQGNLSIKEYTGIYIRDPQGNPIATYRINNDSLTLDELYIYGSSRLGVLKANKHLATQQTIPLPENNELKSKQIPLEAQQLYPYTKHYELTDWLGNVRVLITNRKHLSTTTTPPHFEPQVVGVRDYYPFGMQVGARSYEETDYPFGFNGQEKDDEVTGSTGSHLDFGERVYDSRIGKFLSVDPLTDLMPFMSPYHYTYNNPVYYLENDGKIPWPIAKNGKGTGWNTTHGWFGEKRSTHTHKGVDININSGGNTDLGSPVYSTHTGKVVHFKSYNEHTGSGGTIVIIQSPDGTFQTVYMHLETVSVKKDQEIKEGQQIGTVGGTGSGVKDKWKAHLHYEIRKKQNDGTYKAINPEIKRGELEDPQKWIKVEAKVTSVSSNWYDPIAEWWNSWSFSDLLSNASSYYIPYRISDLLLNTSTNGVNNYSINTQNDPLRFYSTVTGTENDFGTIEKGETVTGTGKVSGNRTEVTYGGKTGWVSSKYLKKQ